MPDDLDAALDRLYGLPADEFTAARDALAKELRGAKRRDEAEAVKQRRRPTAPAAAINQLARHEPELVEDLIRAAGDLVGVQERVLEGDAGRDELRAAADAERRAVGALMAAAAQLPDKPSAAALEKVRDTLHAAATDDAVREAIAGGRLEREAEPAGAWGGAFPLGGLPTEPAADRADAVTRTKAAPAARAKDRAKRAAEEPEEPVVPATDRSAERRARKRAEALERARAEDAEAQRELTDAQAAATEAHELLEAAAQRADAARAAVVEAEAAEDEARSEAQRTLRALKRAEAVAADTAEKVGRLDRG